MNTKLYYLLDSSELFENPESIIANDPTGIYILENDVLTITLNTRCKDMQEAFDIVEPILRSWIFESSHFKGYSQFQFRFQNVENIEETSTSEGYLGQKLEYEKDDKGELVISRLVYPPFPTGRYTVELEAAYNRFYNSFIDLGEPIQSSAYYILTLAEGLLGGRKGAARQLNIEESVLRKIGELTTIKGNIYTARKSLNPLSQDLTSEEKWWLGSRIHQVIIRLGLLNAGVSPEFLSMESRSI